MIIIQKHQYQKAPISCIVGDLTEGNFDLSKNVFVGKCGDGPDHSLYIVSYDCISLLEDTSQSWEYEASVLVREFVDLNIFIVRRDN